MTKQLRDILDKQEARDKLQAEWQTCRNLNQSRYGLPPSQLVRRSLLEALDENVLARLDVPTITTLEEVFNDAFEHFHKQSSFDEAYRHFIEATLQRVGEWHKGEPFTVASVPDFEDFSEWFGKVLWEGESWRVSLDQAEDGCLKARVDGKATSGAIATFSKKIENTLGCILKLQDILWAFHYDWMDYSPVIRPTEYLSLAGSIHEPNELVEILPRLREWLTVLLSKGNPKKQMTARLGNALRFMIEADRQENDAVALVLHFGAIEAVVCDSHLNITQQIKERGSVLLEDDVAIRTDAYKFLDNLYDLRCNCVHGSSIEESRTNRLHAAIIAAAILEAVQDRRDFVASSAAEENVRVFLNGLTDAYKRGNSIPGLSCNPARALWFREEG